MEPSWNSEVRVDLLTNSEKANYTMSQGWWQDKILGKCQLFDMLSNFKKEPSYEGTEAS